VSIPFNSDEASRFLARLAPPEGQYLEVRVIVPDKSPSQFFCRSVDEALGVAKRFSGEANVYVGACPRFRRSGTKSDVNTVMAFWADLDFHQIHSDRNEAKAIALERIYSFPIPPSMIVMTGNGVQAWWALDRPIAVGDDSPLERLEGVNRGIAEMLGGDAVHDLARVLRIAGTVNVPTRKKLERGCTAVPTALILWEGPTHPVEAFDGYVVSTPGTPPAAEEHLIVASAPRTEVVDAFVRLVQELGHAHPVSRTWFGLHEPRDTSRSGWDWALVRELLRVGVRDEYIVDIVRAYPKGRGSLASNRYLTRTLAKARALSGVTHGNRRTHPA
jgi:hypothetical protein